MTIISITYLGNHTYRLVTESPKYGRVTQTILILPEHALSGLTNDQPHHTTP